MDSKSALVTAASVGMALLVGSGLPFQAAANVAIGRALGHPFLGAAISLLISFAAIVPILMLVKAPLPNFANAWQGPWWLWIGGFLGVIYVASATILTPRLGAGGFLVAVVAGQMVTAVLIDHFGVMGLEPKPISVMRVLGVLLILVGVFLIQGGPSRKASVASTVQSLHTSQSNDPVKADHR